MTAALRRTVTVAAACWGCSISSVSLAQEAGQDSAETSAPVASFDEEVIVRGQTLETLRELIREAEEAYFDRFNEINSSDEFDIVCYYRVEIGSKIPRRRCLPNYWRENEEIVGEETARAMQGSGFALSSQIFVAEQFYKERLLADEMQRLTAEDEELLAAVTRLANLRQTLEDAKDMQRGSKSTREREVPDNDGKLAFDAESVFEVRIGRKPWTHDLTQRTFAIARVYGEIRDVGVECAEREEKLEHEPGIEWTLPESWGPCTLVVDAKRDTTFALYEFD